MKNFLRAITLAIFSYLTLHLYGCKSASVQIKNQPDTYPLIEKGYGRFEK